MNGRLRTARRFANLQRTASGDWYRIIRNDAGGPSRVDVYDDIGGGGWFGGGVSASDFVAELAGIPGDLEVHINSGGGDVFDGIAIYNAIAARPGNVTTVIDGIAASIASVIAQAGKTRIIAPGAMMMIHDGLAMCVGNAADFRDMAGLLDQVSDNLASVYAAHSSVSQADWRAAMQAETWYTADDAVAAGLADQLAERPADAHAVAAHDFSMFAKVPDWLAAPVKAATEKSCAEMGHQCCKDTAVADHADIAAAAVDDSPWDGAAAMSAAAKSEDPAAAYKAICAGRKDGDPDKQSSWALPHHKHPGAAPNAAAVRNALARLPQTQGLTNRDAAESHLNAHMSAITPDNHADHEYAGLNWAPDAFMSALTKEEK